MAILTINLLITLTIVLPLSAQATPHPDELMCDEVTFAVDESVTYGTLTQAEADDISDRCYALYTSS